MHKTTAKMPKSRSKYLMQFLKGKGQGSGEKPSIARNNCVTIYSSISGGPHRRGNSTQFSSNMMPTEEYMPQDRGDYVEDDQDSIYQTPESYSTRRRIKKKERYEDYEEPDYSSGSKTLAFESTGCTRQASDLARIRHERRREVMKMNSSAERVKPVQIDDDSIDDIEEEEECDSIPSEEKTKKEIHNEFYQRINRASDHHPGQRDDPYCLLFDQDLSINKMIDEIITNDHYMKFSGAHENIGHEEMKEEMHYDMDVCDDNEIVITHEFNIDDVVTSIREPCCSSPLTREQKRSFKYLNKFKNIRKSKDLYVKDVSPVSQKKKKASFRLKDIETRSGLKRNELAKKSTLRDNSMSSQKRSKNKLNSKCNIDSATERILDSFYSMVSDLSNKTKILDSFKPTGKGGVIELEGEPIFPLKMTLDFVLQDYNNCKFNITTIKTSDSNLKYESPARRAFKESKNINNMSDYRTSSKVVEVEGSVYNLTGSEPSKSFKHQFEIQKNFIDRLLIAA